jgi:hypothetical protein
MEKETKTTKKGTKSTKGKTSKKTTDEQLILENTVNNEEKQEDIKQISDNENEHENNIQSDKDEQENNVHSDNEEKLSENSENSTNIVQNKDDFLNNLVVINNLLTEINKNNFKKFVFTKEELKTCDNIYHKIGTNKEKLNQKMMQINRDVKSSKKQVLKEDGTEIVKDTSNHAVNKKKETFKEVIEFLDLPENSLVSRTDVHRGMIKFIETEKAKVNTDIFYDETKKNFKLIGKMKVLFEFIREEKIKRGKMEETEQLPEYIQNKDIMKYTSYCFPASTKK